MSWRDRAKPIETAPKPSWKDRARAVTQEAPLPKGGFLDTADAAPPEMNFKTGSDVLNAIRSGAITKPTYVNYEVPVTTIPTGGESFERIPKPRIVRRLISQENIQGQALPEEEPTKLPMRLPGPVSKALDYAKRGPIAGPLKFVGENSQALAQAMTTPIRAGRAAGVGVQRLIEGDAPSQALSRAKEAIQPGFRPEPGEKIGSFAGESLAAAPLIAMTGGGGLMAQAGKGALTSGTLTAIQEAAERGDINLVDVGFSGVVGASVPFIAPSLMVVARAIRGSGRVVATAGNTLGKEAVDILEKNPRLLEMYKGTAETVGQKAVAIQQALVKQHEKVAAFLERVRKNIGFREPFMEAAKRIERSDYKPKAIPEIIQEFRILKTGKVPVEAVRPARTAVVQGEERSVMGAVAKEEVKRRIPARAVKTQVEFPDKLRLRELYRLREEIDGHLSFPQGSGDVPRIGKADQFFLQTLRRKINETIESIPGGKILRAADQAFHMSRELYDELQKKLATQGAAEDTVRAIMKGGDITEIIGKRAGDAIRLLRELERKTGQKLVDPAVGELAAKSFREMKPTGFTGIVPSALGPEGTANFLRFAGGLSEIPEAAALPFVNKVTSPIIKGALYPNGRGRER